MHKNPPPLLSSSFLSDIKDGVIPPWETLSVEAKIHVLLLRHQDRLLSVATRMLPPNIWIDPPSVVLHACFLFIKGDPEVHVSEQAFLVGIVRNLCYRIIRDKKQWIGFFPIEEIDWMDVRLESMAYSPDDEAERSDRDARLHDAVSKLPDVYREAIQLYYIEQLPWAEICRLTQMNIPSFRNRLRTARDKLRNILR